MMGMISALLAQEWVRKIIVVLSLVLAVLLALAGMKRKAKEQGKQIERERQRIEVRKAEKRMEAIARPDTSNVDSRLQDGTF